MCSRCHSCYRLTVQGLEPAQHRQRKAWCIPCYWNDSQTLQGLELPAQQRRRRAMCKVWNRECSLKIRGLKPLAQHKAQVC